MNLKINPYYTVFEYGRFFFFLLFNVNLPFKCQINNTCPCFFFAGSQLSCILRGKKLILVKIHWKSVVVLCFQTFASLVCGNSTHQAFGNSFNFSAAVWVNQVPTTGYSSASSPSQPEIPPVFRACTNSEEFSVERVQTAFGQ